MMGVQACVHARPGNGARYQKGCLLRAGKYLSSTFLESGNYLDSLQTSKLLSIITAMALVNDWGATLNDIRQ